MVAQDNELEFYLYKTISHLLRFQIYFEKLYFPVLNFCFFAFMFIPIFLKEVEFSQGFTALTVLLVN